MVVCVAACRWSLCEEESKISSTVFTSKHNVRKMRKPQADMLREINSTKREQYQLVSVLSLADFLAGWQGSSSGMGVCGFGADVI